MLARLLGPIRWHYFRIARDPLVNTNKAVALRFRKLQA